MPDAVAIVAITISLITTLGGILLGLHMKRCHSLCCDSDCSQNNNKTPPDTPIALNSDGIIKQLPFKQTDV
jgi:hypothetical protein